MVTINDDNKIKEAERKKREQEAAVLAELAQQNFLRTGHPHIPAEIYNPSNPVAAPLRAQVQDATTTTPTSNAPAVGATFAGAAAASQNANNAALVDSFETPTTDPQAGAPAKAQLQGAAIADEDTPFSWASVDGYGEEAAKLLNNEDGLVEDELWKNNVVVQASQKVVMYDNDLDDAGFAELKTKIQNGTASTDDKELYERVTTPVENLTDEQKQELVEDAISQIGWFNNNIVSTGVNAKRLLSDDTPADQKVAFMFMMDIDANTKWMDAGNFGSKIGRIARQGVLADPVMLGTAVFTVLTVFTGSKTILAAKTAQEATKQTIKVGLRKAVRESVEASVKQAVTKVVPDAAVKFAQKGVVKEVAGVAAVSGSMGAVDGAISNSLEQIVRLQGIDTDGDGITDVKVQANWSNSQLATATAFSGAFGAAFGSVTYGAAKGVKAFIARRKAKGAELKTDVDAEAKDPNVRTLKEQVKPTLEPRRRTAYAHREGDTIHGAFIPGGDGKKAKIILNLAGGKPHTFMHEAAHYFLDTLMDFAKSQRPGQSVYDDAGKALKFMQVPGKTDAERFAAWDAMTTAQRNDHHERFAHGFERFLKDGSVKNTPASLKKVFRTFKDFIKRIFDGAPENSKISAEMRQVYGRLIATDGMDDDAVINVASKISNDLTNAKPMNMNASDVGDNALLLGHFYEAMAKRIGDGETAESLYYKHKVKIELGTEHGIEEQLNKLTPAPAPEAAATAGATPADPKPKAENTGATPADPKPKETAAESTGATPADPKPKETAAESTGATPADPKPKETAAESTESSPKTEADAGAKADGDTKGETKSDAEGKADGGKTKAGSENRSSEFRQRQERFQDVENYGVIEALLEEKNLEYLQNISKKVDENGDIDKEYMLAYFKRNDIDIDPIEDRIDNYFQARLQQAVFMREMREAVEKGKDFKFDEKLAEYPRVRADDEPQIHSAHSFAEDARIDYKNMLGTNELYRELLDKDITDIKGKAESNRSGKEKKLLKAVEAVEGNKNPAFDKDVVNAYSALKDVPTLPKFVPNLRNSYVYARLFNREVIKNPTSLFRIMPWNIPADSRKLIRKVIKNGDEIFNENKLAEKLVKLQKEIANETKCGDLDLAKGNVARKMERFARANGKALREMEVKFAMMAKEIEQWDTIKPGLFNGKSALFNGVTEEGKDQLLKYANDMREIAQNLQNAEPGKAFGKEGDFVRGAADMEELLYGINRIHKHAYLSNMRNTKKDPVTDKKAYFQFRDSLAREMDAGIYMTERPKKGDMLPKESKAENTEKTFDVTMKNAYDEIRTKGKSYWNPSKANALGAEFANLIKNQDMLQEVMFLIKFGRQYVSYEASDGWQGDFLAPMKSALDMNDPYYQKVFSLIEKASADGDVLGGGQPGWFGTNWDGASGGRMLEAIKAQQSFLPELRTRFMGDARFYSTPFRLTLKDIWNTGKDDFYRYMSGAYYKLDDEGNRIQLKDDGGKPRAGYEKVWSRPEKEETWLTKILGYKAYSNSKYIGTPVRIMVRGALLPEYVALKGAKIVYTNTGNAVLIGGAGAGLWIAGEEFGNEIFFNKEDDERGQRWYSDLGAKTLGAAIDASAAFTINAAQWAHGAQAAAWEKAWEWGLGRDLTDQDWQIGWMVKPHADALQWAEDNKDALKDVIYTAVSDQGEFKYSINHGFSGMFQTFDHKQERKDFVETFKDIDSLIAAADTQEQKIWLQDLALYKPRILENVDLAKKELEDATIALYGEDGRGGATATYNNSIGLQNENAAKDAFEEASQEYATAFDNMNMLSRMMHESVAIHTRVENSLEQEILNEKHKAETAWTTIGKYEAENELSKLRSIEQKHNDNAQMNVEKLAGLTAEERAENHKARKAGKSASDKSDNKETKPKTAPPKPVIEGEEYLYTTGASAGGKGGSSRSSSTSRDTTDTRTDFNARSRGGDRNRNDDNKAADFQLPYQVRGAFNSLADTGGNFFNWLGAEDNALARGALGFSAVLLAARMLNSEKTPNSGGIMSALLPLGLAGAAAYGLMQYNKPQNQSFQRNADTDGTERGYNGYRPRNMIDMTDEANHWARGSNDNGLQPNALLGKGSNIPIINQATVDAALSEEDQAKLNAAVNPQLAPSGTN